MQGLTITNRQTRLILSESMKGAVASLMFGESQIELVVPQTDLWIIRKVGRDGETVLLRSSQAESFGGRQKDDVTVLEWKFSAPQMEVQVGVRRQKDAEGIILTWSASGEINVLEEADIEFPIIQASTSILHCVDQGPYELEPRDTFPETLCLYPGQAAMQFLVGWGERFGLYLAAHDAGGYTKSLGWSAARSLRLIYHQPGRVKLAERKRTCIPYNVVIAAYEGDWRPGADIYKEWVHRFAPWCQRGSLADRSPEWMKECSVWFYKFGDFPVIMDDHALKRLRQVLGINGHVVIRKWEPEEYSDTTHPTIRPPQWILDYKKNRIETLNRNRFHVVAYRNAHKYTRDFLPDEEPQFKKCSVTRFGNFIVEGGNPLWPCHTVYHVQLPASGDPPCAFTVRGEWDSIGDLVDSRGVEEDRYGEWRVCPSNVTPEDEPCVMPASTYQLEMCVSCDFWKAQVLEAVRSSVEYGSEGNYLDQIGANSTFKGDLWTNDSSRCDDTNGHHGHPTRGGNWYVRHHEEIIGQIVSLYRQHGVQRPLLSHEFFTEPLVGRLNVTRSPGRMTVLRYSYHSHFFFEGNDHPQSAQSPKQLREKLAEAIHYGRIPMISIGTTKTFLPGVSPERFREVIVNPDDPADDEALGLLRHWLGVREAWASYLNFGTMVTPPPKGDPCTSVWRGLDRSVAVFFSNYGDTEKLVEVDLAPYNAGPIWTVWLNARLRQGTFDQRVSTLFKRNLAPNDTFILESQSEGPTGQLCLLGVEESLSRSAKYVRDASGNASSLSLSATGFVGIGSEHPTTPLEVHGREYLITATTADPGHDVSARIAAESPAPQGRIQLDWVNDNTYPWDGGYGLLLVGKSTNSPALKILAGGVIITIESYRVIIDTTDKNHPVELIVNGVVKAKAFDQS